MVEDPGSGMSYGESVQVFRVGIIMMHFGSIFTLNRRSMVPSH
jgi:hypothetical protein